MWGFPANSHAQYQRTGSVENLWHYLAREVFAVVFWASLGVAGSGLVGSDGVVVGRVFVYVRGARFQFSRSQRPDWNANKHGEPVNQIIYGLFAGEWHENHHDYPLLARSGLSWWQVDVPHAGLYWQ